MPKTKNSAIAEPKGLFFVPEDGKYFCICHQTFWVRKSSFENHMTKSKTKKNAGARAVQCKKCHRWFKDEARKNAHYQRVNSDHTLPDTTDYVIVAVEDNEQGGLKMESRRILCLNTEDPDLDDLKPQVVPLK